jgi:N-acetyl-anhydromuramyl-L-alanine amidase AmpD
VVLGLSATAAAPPKPPLPAPSGASTSIIVAGQPFAVGRPVVLWNDSQGFDGYHKRCIDQSGGCCDQDNDRYGTRKGVTEKSLRELEPLVSQLVLHFDGCVNSRSCFKSMHNRPRPGGGCGLSAHFMVDTDGTIYQTLDVVERAYHAELSNSVSVGVEICNRGRVDPSEWPRLPAEYRTRPTREVVINGSRYRAYDFRPEQYQSIVALARTLLRVFPKIKPVIPEKDGEPLLETLDDPTGFAGIVGHLHVDVQKNKWDPGALDWKRLLRSLNGFVFPIQVRSFTEVPRAANELLAARRAAFSATEERATGFFPIGAGRFWHSGVHLKGTLGAPVRAPTRGLILAARSGEVEGSSTSFVLMRHDLDLDGVPLRFYSLLAHLELPPLSSASSVPWMQAVSAPGRAAVKAALARGEVALLSERVEAGDVIGFIGEVSRGPEQGPEVHFEIFTADKLPGELGRGFRYLNASGDGVIARRGDLVALADGNGDLQIDADELRRLHQQGDLDGRQALRRVAIRHQHEWGDRTSAADFVSTPELGGVPSADRHKLYRKMLSPYTFWTDALSQHAELPRNQTVYFYNAVTFLLEIASRSNHVSVPSARGRDLSDRAIEPTRLEHVPLAQWLKPSASPRQAPLFGPPIGVDLKPRRKEDIPLFELPPTDSR